jgi:isocitrate/isopropylmalate dehydrogenase
VPTPLANVKPGDIDMVIVRENTEGLYCQNWWLSLQGTATRSREPDRR